MMIQIDSPVDRELSQRVCEIEGWCTVPLYGVDRLRFEIDGSPVLYTPIRRIDAEAAYPRARVKGFRLHIDLTCYMHAVRDSKLHLKVIAGDVEESQVQFHLSRSALRICMTAACGL
jgi:hypothetical protein